MCEIKNRGAFLERFRVPPINLYFKHVKFRIIVHIISGHFEEFVSNLQRYYFGGP